jgi:hypothetical protein
VPDNGPGKGAEKEGGLNGSGTPATKESFVLSGGGWGGGERESKKVGRDEFSHGDEFPFAFPRLLAPLHVRRPRIRATTSEAEVAVGGVAVGKRERERERERAREPYSALEAAVIVSGSRG